MRCHMSSPKGKGRNLISFNSVAVMYFPACWFVNTNVQWLPNLVHLATTALPKRLSLIFLWAGFSRRYPIPIVDPLIYTVCIFCRSMGCTLLFGFSVRLRYWFKNRPPLLVLTCWQCDENLEVFWEHKWWVKLHIESVLEEYIMSVVDLTVLIYINMCCILPNYLQIEN